MDLNMLELVSTSSPRSSLSNYQPSSQSAPIATASMCTASPAASSDRTLVNPPTECSSLTSEQLALKSPLPNSELVYDSRKQAAHHRVVSNSSNEPRLLHSDKHRLESRSSVEARYLLHAQASDALDEDDLVFSNGMISNEMLEDVLHDVVDAENEETDSDEEKRGDKPKVKWYIQLVKLMSSTIGLVFVVFLYAFLGALMFQLLEQHEELRLCEGNFKSDFNRKKCWLIGL